MKGTILSPVHIISADALSAKDLYTILCYAAHTMDVKHIAVVCDRAPIPVRDTLLQELASYCDVHVFDSVRQNPLTSDINAMVSSPEFSKSSLVLGFGGGSVLDSAKGMAMLATNGGTLEEYVAETNPRQITTPPLPLVLIPTTAGTGSEVTKVGVYSVPSGRKYSLNSPMLYPNTAVLLASCIDTVPPALCAATGLDALDHALESIWSKHATPLTRNLAEQAACDILTWLPILYRNKVNNHSDTTVQKHMLEASCMAGVAFSTTGTASGHAISFVLSENWHIPHGAACAFTLLEVFDWASGDMTVAESLTRIGTHFFPNSKNALSDLRTFIASLMDEMNIPRSFEALGVTISKEDIRKEFSRCMNDAKLFNQLPPLGEEDLYTLLEEKL